MVVFVVVVVVVAVEAVSSGGRGSRGSSGSSGSSSGSSSTACGLLLRLTAVFLLGLEPPYDPREPVYALGQHVFLLPRKTDPMRGKHNALRSGGLAASRRWKWEKRTKGLVSEWLSNNSYLRWFSKWVPLRSVSPGTSKILPYNTPKHTR